MKTKILLISDIHGNFPALAAIDRELSAATNFNRIINAGDSLVYAPFANQTMTWLQEKRALSILGNTDKKVIKLLKGKSFKKPGKKEKRIMYSSTAETLSRQSIASLLGLKKSITCTLRVTKNKHIRLGIYHGSPAAHHEFLFATTPDSRFRELSQSTDCDIIITGHSHSPYHKIIDGKHFINPGSVGRMFDGSPTASCAVLQISSARIEVTHHRIPYPVEEVIAGIRKAGLPEIYCQMYRQGKKLN